MAGKVNYIAFIMVLLLAGTFTNCRHIMKTCSQLPAAHTVELVQQASTINIISPAVNARETETGSPLRLALKFID